MKALVIRIMMMTGGLTTIGFCVALLQIVALGTDPFSSLNIGISNTIGISFGNFLLIINFLLFMIILWKKRSLIGIGTIVSMVGVGYVVDFFFNIITGLGEINLSFTFRILLMIVAILLLSLAASLYMTADLGIAPYDAMAIIIEEVTKQRIVFKWARIGTDVTCVFIGFLFGATIGLATFITAFLLGPLISFFRINVASVLLNKIEEDVEVLSRKAS